MNLRQRWVAMFTAGALLGGGAWFVVADERPANGKPADVKAADAKPDDDAREGESDATPDSERARSSGDEDAIRQSADEFAKAYNAGDAKAIAALFVEDGEYIDEFKNIFKGRDAIEKEMAAFFEAAPGNQIEISVEEIRIIGDAMAIEEGVTRLTPADDSPAVDSRYVAVHLKQGGQWRIAAVRDLEGEVPTPHEHLRQLDWLVGEWVDESEGSKTKTSTRWSDDGNFLLSDFHIETAGIRTLDGTQRIGWDPIRKQIRSWAFDSEGGFAEGTWTRVDDDWLIKIHATRADGISASATNMYQQLDGKTLRWSSTERIVDGELQPDVSVVIVRQPPEAGATQASVDDTTSKDQ